MKEFMDKLNNLPKPVQYIIAIIIFFIAFYISYSLFYSLNQDLTIKQLSLFGKLFLFSTVINPVLHLCNLLLLTYIYEN